MATDEAPPGWELTPRIGRPATQALALAGYRAYVDIARSTERELLAIHGVGPKALRIIGEELASRGLAFADRSS